MLKKFFTCYNSKETHCFDPPNTLLKLHKSNVFYCLFHPVYNKNYVSKTDHNLVTHCQHLLRYFMDIVNLMNLPDIDSITITIDEKQKTCYMSFYLNFSFYG